VLRLGTLLITMGLLSGCATTKEKALMHSYQENIEYHKQLQKTEKIQLFENNVTKMMLTATYLYTPNFKKYDQRDEVFIIGLHLEDETEAGMEDMMEIFGIRSTEDIWQMRQRQKEKRYVVPNSLYDDLKNFLSVHPMEQIKDEKKHTYSKKSEEKSEKYGLLLHGEKALDIKVLDRNNPKLKNIAYVTQWGSYYLVTFEHTDKKSFTLDFKSKRYGSGTFPFAKEAKYIKMKKSF